MGSRASTTSVIAKLMGLDDLPNQHLNQKRGRVLSEKYFQRVASIGLRERSPSPEHYSFWMSPKNSEDFCSFIRVMGAPRQDKLNMKEAESKNLHLNKNVKIRCPEETSYVLGGLSDTSRMPLEIALLRSRHGTEQDSSSDFSWPGSCKSSTAGYMKSKDCLGPSRYWRDSSNEVELLGQRPRVTSEEVEEISKQLKFITMGSGSLSGPNGKKGQNRQSSVTSSTSSFIAREAKKEISERFMMMELQELGAGSRRKKLGEMLSMHSHQTRPQNSSYSSHGSRKGMMNAISINNRSKRSELSGHPFVYNSGEKVFTSMEELQPGKTSFFYNKSQSSCSLNSECNSSVSGADEAWDLSEEKNLAILCVKESETPGRSSKVGTSPCGTMAWNSQMKQPVPSSANSSENLLEEEELTEFAEEDSASSHSSVGRESFKSFEEAYQPSPDSVLRPVEDEILSDLRNDLSGMQILPSKLDSSEQCLDGNKMTLSSEEEDNDGQSFSNFEETEDFIRFLRAEDSRDFSYLVDVLFEAGLHRGNLIESLIKWQTIESPLDSVIFEVLEKKYGEQKSWRRSERKLFFDRINLVLMETLQQSICMPSWAKPIAVQMSSRWGTEITEEALWTLMVKQEKEAKKESGNVLEDDIAWLDLGECVDIVSREIEKLLVEELEAEFF